MTKELLATKERRVRKEPLVIRVRRVKLVTRVLLEIKAIKVLSGHLPQELLQQRE